MSYEQKISLFCLYGRNNDNPGFYEVLRDKLLTIDNPCILVGDFNLVLDPEKDYQNYININNPRARQTVLDLKLECDLVDCWREEHIAERKYTWLRKNPFKQARLDFFLISGSLYSKVDDCDILPGYRTDHSMITLTLLLDKCSKGNSYWKFNNTLLKDGNFVQKIKEVITQTKLLYASNNQDSDQPIPDIENMSLRLNISDSLFF